MPEAEMTINGVAMTVTYKAELDVLSMKDEDITVTEMLVGDEDIDIMAIVDIRVVKAAEAALRAQAIVTKSVRFAELNLETPPLPMERQAS